MKNFVLLFMALCLMGACNSDSNEALYTNAENENNPTLENALTNPDGIGVNLRILAIPEGSTEVCGLKKQQVAEIEILQVNKVGRNLTHTPKKNTRFTWEFLSGTDALEIGQVLQVSAKEKLCPNGTTYFSVLGYKQVSLGD
jgi:hypothetical protein